MAPESTRLQTAGELASAGRQVWDAISGWFGRDRDDVQVTLLFTDLCGFSSWVLEAGDQRALELLREVAAVVEPCITANQGKVVKRLGDGHMAAFPDATGAVEAALGMQEALADLDGAEGRTPGPDGEPRLRAGLHSGHPHRLDGDYLGADVNIAARITDAARAGEVLVSGEVLEDVTAPALERLEVKRRRAFRARGTPPDLEVFCVTPRAQG
ncbi:MAG TPA: adenylate/guanylate cyclase domain-containing protein [Solirubrobacteraceae bacterium]|jgi:adenylate cyclase|nr:adenylate/guanylate cyclase domain-containing protein [Solirubrobacteraceae bacterium]